MADGGRQTNFPPRQTPRTNSDAVGGSTPVQSARKYAAPNPTPLTSSRSSVMSSPTEGRNVWPVHTARKSSTAGSAPPPTGAARKFAPRPARFAAKIANNTMSTNMGPPGRTNPVSAPSTTSSATYGGFREPFNTQTFRHGNITSRASIPFPPATPVHRARLMTGLPARKSVAVNSSPYPFAPYNRTPVNSQSIHRRSAISHMTPSDVTPVKSTKLLAPSWHAEEALRKSGSAVDFVPQISFASAPRRDARAIARGNNRGLNPENLTKAYIGPNMDLRVTGEDPDSDVEAIPRGIPRRNIGNGQMATKAARKTDVAFMSSRKSANPRLVGIDSSEESEVSSSPGASSGGSRPGSSPGSPGTVSDASGEDMHRRSFSPPQLPSPPRVASPPTRVPFTDTTAAYQPEHTSGPSEELMLALEKLTLSPLRMQKTRQLPFLLRNLRRGFQNRCRLLGVPTGKISEEVVSVSILYKYAVRSTRQGHVYTARMTSWLCPLCELHGQFETKRMLEKHLNWDHHQVGVTWRRDTSEEMTQRWKIELSISEPVPEEQNYEVSRSIPLQARGSIPAIGTDDERSVLISQHPVPQAQQHIPSPHIPSPVARPSPSIVTQSTRATTSVTLSPIPPKLKFRDLSPIPTRSTSQPITSRGRSSTAMPSTSGQKSSDISRYPTPPPQSKPLGPSAQYPYIPAKSEYGGPDIYYSCRPGGPRLYDLLNTLPMEPFGVLSWAVLDREEEIFECDDIKDEYKVMHALWARWIMLYRNKFIANYYLGTIAFVDEYWRMIHRAAGWDALRYWLLMLLANRFINGSEVAKVLRHYEGLTGMESWYD